jgi:hypothetical protein
LFWFSRFSSALKADICDENVKSVLLIMDPRDALVSEYFSFKPGRSHVLPKEDIDKFIAAAKKSEGLSIDQYVLNNAKNTSIKFTQYRENLNFANVKVFKYEDIFCDKYLFLKAIFEHFNIEVEVEDAILQDVAKENNTVPKKKIHRNI